MCVTSPFTWGRSCQGQVRQPRPKTPTQAVYLRGFALSYRTLHLHPSSLLAIPPLVEVVLCEEDVRGLGRARLRPMGGRKKGKKRKSRHRGRWHRETAVPPFLLRGDDYGGEERERERERERKRQTARQADRQTERDGETVRPKKMRDL